MTDSVYKIITLVGNSKESWEKAAASAIDQAFETLEDLRIAGLEELVMILESMKISEYREMVRLSFKYKGKEGLKNRYRLLCTVTKVRPQARHLLE